MPSLPLIYIVEFISEITKNNTYLLTGKAEATTCSLNAPLESEAHHVALLPWKHDIIAVVHKFQSLADKCSNFAFNENL